jgi:hypothetical protein
MSFLISGDKKLYYHMCYEKILFSPQFNKLGH